MEQTLSETCQQAICNAPQADYGGVAAIAVFGTIVIAGMVIDGLLAEHEHRQTMRRDAEDYDGRAESFGLEPFEPKTN